ncbi:MAG: response regulator [Bacteroidota bacterium]
MKKIVIVDDFGTQRKLVKSILADLPVQLLECRNGQEALKTINEVKPSCVITDLEMPEMDGLKLVKEIRKENSSNQLPVIMISSRSEREQEALRKGVNKWITKPYDGDHLRNVINTVMGGIVDKQSYKVLILHEQYMQTNLWESTLTRAGFELDTVESARTAMQMLRSHQYDALITEALESGSNGIKLIKKMKESPIYKKIPVIIINGSQKDRRTPLSKQVDLVLDFPFNPKSVKKLVNKRKKTPLA